MLEEAAPGSARRAARGQAPRPSRRTHKADPAIVDFLTASFAGVAGFDMNDGVSLPDDRANPSEGLAQWHRIRGLELLRENNSRQT